MPNTTPNISSELAGSKVRSSDRVLNLSALLSRRVVDYVVLALVVLQMLVPSWEGYLN